MFDDSSLYFAVLPRDFVKGYLKRFCFDYRLLSHYLSINVGTEYIGSVSFDLDGNLVVPLYTENEVRLYSCKTGALLGLIGEGQPLATAVDRNGRIYVAEKECIKLFNPDGFIDQDVCGLLVDGDLLHLGGWFGVTTLPTGRTIDIENCNGWVHALTLVSKRVAVYADRRLYFLDDDGANLVCFTNGYAIRQIAADYDDNVYIVNGDDLCQVYNYGHLVGQLDYKFYSPTGCAISNGVLVVIDRNGIHLF